MPYIKTTTSAKLTDSDKQILKDKLGELIALFPGKSEQWLMIAINDGVSMAFRGDMTTPCAMIEIDIFGAASKSTYDNVTRAVCEAVSEIIKVDADHIYVKYGECDKWGYDGFNF